MTATGNEAVRLSQLKTLAGASSNSVSLLSSSGNEAVTVDQAAEALGLETAGGATGQCAITLSQLKMAYEYNPLKIVTWADGTDKQIAAMVAAADAGEINLSDYWHEGDTRTVSLSAMSATGVGESHAAQSVRFVLTDPGHYTLANGKPCNFVVLQKDCLKERGRMNQQGTNSGGWDRCKRRTWCNSVYRNAIPSTLRGIFKQFTTYAGIDNSSPISVASSDYFALFSEREVFGSTTYADSTTESQNTQLNYYKTSSNRVKKVNGSANRWWERSLHGGNSIGFCCVDSSGAAKWGAVYDSHGLAPFGCI